MDFGIGRSDVINPKMDPREKYNARAEVLYAMQMVNWLGLLLSVSDIKMFSWLLLAEKAHVIAQDYFRGSDVSIIIINQCIFFDRIGLLLSGRIVCKDAFFLCYG